MMQVFAVRNARSEIASSQALRSGIRVALSLCLVAVIASPASAQIESRVGTWELNLAKSTFSPGPPPQRQTLVFEAAGPQWTALLQGIDAAGKPINPDVNNLSISFDERDHVTPTADYETTAWKCVDANTYQVIRKKAGKVVLTSTNVLSKDGRTMTITTKGHDAAGQTINNVRVYDKQVPFRQGTQRRQGTETSVDANIDSVQRRAVPSMRNR
jgi:hypothetical protein